MSSEMSASTPMAGGNEDNKGNDVGKNTKQGAEAVIKKKRQKHQQFGMTFMKLKFLEWEKRLCAGIAKLNYLLVARVGREVAGGWWCETS